MKKTNLLVKVILILLVIYVFVDKTSADIVIYTNINDFISATGSLNYETFEGLTIGSISNTFTLDDFTISVPDELDPSDPDYIDYGDPLKVNLADYPGVNPDLMSGNTILLYFHEGGSLTFDFQNPVTAIGMSLQDAVDNNNRIDYSTDTGEQGLALINGSNNTTIFFGVVASEPFSRFTFHHVIAPIGDGMAIDNVMLDTEIPGPAANAGPDISIYDSEQNLTTINGSGIHDTQGTPLEYRWLEGDVILQDWTDVGVGGAANLSLGDPVPTFAAGYYILTLEVKVKNTTEVVSDTMNLTVLNSIVMDIYTDIDAFNLATGSVKTETFDGLTVGSVADTFSLDDFTITSPGEVPGGPDLGWQLEVFEADTWPGSGYYDPALMGGKVLRGCIYTDGSLTFEFPTPVTALGISFFDIANDWGGAGANYSRITYSTDTGYFHVPALETTVGIYSTGEWIFFGVVDTVPFSRFTLHYEYSKWGDVIGIDNVMLNLPTNTPPGQDVEVSDPETGTTIVFDNVDTGGETTVTVTQNGPPPPTGFKLVPLGTYYEINTTAAFSGVIQIEIEYDDSGLSTGQENALKLRVYEESTDEWVNITTSLDTVNNIIYGETTHLSFFAITTRTSVDIDIKPNSYPNVINLGSQGVIPVAILSSSDFDATTVHPDTVELAGSGVAVRGKGDKYLAHEEDVNGDGLIDLVCKVETENFDPGSFQDGYAILTGETYDGIYIEGSDEITIVPPE